MLGIHNRVVADGIKVIGVKIRSYLPPLNTTVMPHPNERRLSLER
jgi:hypothetical protein